VKSLGVIGEGLVELELDETTDRLRLGAGGDAANIAVMAARLGSCTRLGGRVGADPFGERLLSFWRSCGVDLTSVRVDPDAATGLYLNTATSGGEHRFVYWRTGSAGSRLLYADLRDSFFAELAILVVTGITLAISRQSADTALEAIARARACGSRIACVLNYRPTLAGDIAELTGVARSADIVIGSREDASAVFGEEDPKQLRHDLMPTCELVLTAGGEPVRAAVGGAMLVQPVPATSVVNAAGAGDAFAGAYLACRAAGQTTSKALAWGVAASTSSVSRRGCASSYPSLREVDASAHRLLNSTSRRR
jgi:2-dehydro-3-deoxygluconokinase